jgi:hypothetical protein
LIISAFGYPAAFATGTVGAATAVILALGAGEAA